MCPTVPLLLRLLLLLLLLLCFASQLAKLMQQQHRVRTTRHRHGERGVTRGEALLEEIVSHHTGAVAKEAIGAVQRFGPIAAGDSADALLALEALTHNSDEAPHTKQTHIYTKRIHTYTYACMYMYVISVCPLLPFSGLRDDLKTAKEGGG